MTEGKYILDFEKPLQDLTHVIVEVQKQSLNTNVDVSNEIMLIQSKIADTREKAYSHLSAWQRVQIARHPNRPHALDYVSRIFSNFQELHGDRSFADDHSTVCGTAMFEGSPVMIIAQQKGRSTKENIYRNFGCPNPEGYRKAMRTMELASRFGLPIISFIDTSGAYPGIGSEERHVAEAIARNIRDMFLLEVPIIAIVIGEGGSGGALGIAVADRVLVLENSYYSVISPEGCAAILWRDRAKASCAAEALGLTSDKLLKLGVIEEIIKEPLGGAHNDYDQTAHAVEQAICSQLNELKRYSTRELLDLRYERFRRLGVFVEDGVKEGL